MNIRALAIRGLAVSLVLGLLGAGPAAGAPEDKAVVTGRVTFQGEAAQDVMVVLRTSEGKQRRSAWTDDDGRYTFPNAPSTAAWPADEWAVMAVEYGEDHQFPGLPTYSGDTARLGGATFYRFAPGTSTTIDIAMVAGATVTGRVLNAQGEPVKNTAVQVRHTTREGAGIVTTDSHGNYSVSGLGSGLVDISAWKKRREGGAASTAILGETVTAPDIVLHKVPRKGTIDAKVSRLKKHDTLFLYNVKTHWSAPIGWKMKPTKKKGTVTLRTKVEPGTYRLVIAGTNVASKKFTVRPGKSTTVKPFKGPKKRSTVKGKIKRGDGFIEVYDSYGTRAPLRNLSGEDGTYKVKRLGKGRYTVQVMDPTQRGARATVKVKVKNGKVTTKNIKLRKLTTVTGTVTHDGTPVRGVRVGVVLMGTGCIVWRDDPDGMWPDSDARKDGCVEEYLPTVLTDENGRFTLPDVARGKVVLRASDDDVGGYATLVKTFTIKKNSSVSLEVSS